MAKRSSTCSMMACGDRVVGRKLCRKHYQAAWRRGEFVNDPLPPRVAGKTVCSADHKHQGSSTCYIQHRCRCVPCKKHHSAMENRRTRLKAYGRFDNGLVDAAPVREHVMMLAEYGMGYKQVARIAGLGNTPVRNLIYGRQEPGPRYGELQKNIKRATAAKILAVKPKLDNLAGGALVTARGTHRRLQALVAIGYSKAKLAARLGMEDRNFGLIFQRTQVTVRVHREVDALFNELWNAPPPRDTWHDKSAYTRAINHAKKRRWLPPLAWDDIDNDLEPPIPDEDAGIDEVRVQLAIAGDSVRLTPAERRLAVTALHRSLLSDTAIAERLHITDRSVLRIRQELQLNAFPRGQLVPRGSAA